MPTISQLPPADGVTAVDEVPLSQGGIAKSVTVGTLLAGTQPAIMASPGDLLGRVSLGVGTPESIAVGTGLALNSDTLAATGADHAGFPVGLSLVPTDQAVLSSGGAPKLLGLSLLRGLFSPGPNISIDSSGTISALISTSGGTGSTITGLPTVSTITGSDLVGISQGGSDRTITYRNFIDGQTIDEVQPSGAVLDGDTLLVAQAANILSRQSFSAVWSWISSKLSTYTLPITEVTVSTVLNASAHNGHLMVCSQPVTLTCPVNDVGGGFYCDVVNLSGGNVTFAGGLVSSSGSVLLGSGQSAKLMGIAFSGGTVVYACVGGAGVATSLPGQVTGLAASVATATTIELSWQAQTPTPSSFVVQYRPTGTGAWLSGPSTNTAGCEVTGLSSGVGYDFVVSALNNAGMGMASAIVTAATPAGVGLPGQVVGVAGGAATASSVSIGWLGPLSGGAPVGYIVQYRVSGSTAWLPGASNVTSLSDTVTGLTAATSYDFQVIAVNGAGAGLPSAVVTVSTSGATGAVTSISWNVIPAGPYVHGSGTIGVNARVSPANAPVQFGFSDSAVVPPSSWVDASFVNSDLWGAYVPTPGFAGIWYAWVEGTDGSASTVSQAGFTVT